MAVYKSCRGMLLMAAFLAIFSASVASTATSDTTTKPTTHEPTTMKPSTHEKTTAKASTHVKTTVVITTTAAAPKPVNNSIFQVLADQELFSFIRLVSQAKIDQMLQDSGNYTVFAPTDDAIEKFIKDNAHLDFGNDELIKALVLNHIITGAVYNRSELLAQKGPLISSIDGSLFINGRNKTITDSLEGTAEADECFVNGKPIEANHTASNGVVHVITAVIFPIGSISAWDYVDSSDRTSVASFFVDQAGSTAKDIFTDLSHVNTYFIPINQAWTALPFDVVQQLLNDPKALSGILLLHVVPAQDSDLDQPLFSPAILDGTVLETASGKNLTVTVSSKDGVKINGAKVVWPDVAAKNGVVHLIDSIIVSN